MQIAEPARNEGRPRQLDGPFEMFGRGSVVLLCRSRSPRQHIESLVDSSASELEKEDAQSLGELEAERLAKNLPFLARPGT
jgi:hypothetical protein